MRGTEIRIERKIIPIIQDTDYSRLNLLMKQDFCHGPLPSVKAKRSCTDDSNNLISDRSFA